ncbi:MAG: NADH-quinone oxidoreductase subunit NuoK [candidate division Zixibacteria bacterium]|nr:NADH-quinone oxidoreductase subunit NuoK [candidate division Zixibacteria bacterium]
MTPVHFLGVSVLLFGVGLLVVLTRRNAVAVLMGVELMLNAVNVAFVTFDRVYGPARLDGQLFSLFIITVAAAEAVVGLALILAIYRSRATVAVDELRDLRG